MRFKILSTNHIIIKCKINKIEGNFLIDTGASNSCINYLFAEKFNLNTIKSLEKASSATNEINDTYFSKSNTLEIDNLKKLNFEIILFDMTYINNSLKEKNLKVVDGIIGGDILNEFNANINYEKKLLNLKL